MKPYCKVLVFKRQTRHHSMILKILGWRHSLCLLYLKTSFEYKPPLPPYTWWCKGLIMFLFFSHLLISVTPTTSLTLNVYIRQLSFCLVYNICTIQDQRQTMFVLALLTCIMLRAFSAQAKVVMCFEECKEIFYKTTEPRGMDPDGKKICQKYEDGGFIYATLYSVSHRIPLYSAYTFDPACSSTAGRIDDWYIEPQVTMCFTVNHKTCFSSWSSAFKKQHSSVQLSSVLERVVKMCSQVQILLQCCWNNTR